MQSIALKEWDKQGIDLLCLAEDGHIELAAQCKTSQKRELGTDDLREAKASIKRFRETGYVCDTYLFLINGDSRNIDYNNAIESELHGLTAHGRAKRAEFWPRPRLLDQAFVRMKRILAEALRQQAVRRQLAIHKLFRFGEVYLPIVPVTEEQLILKAGSPCRRKAVCSNLPRPLAALLQESKKTRWTLLTGVFGAGKTTTALQASSRGVYTSIFVAASELGRRAQRQGTATIAQEIADTLRIFSVDADPIDGFFVIEETDEELFTDLAGPALASLLRSETPDHMLLIDGLDENRLYLHPGGFQLLSNQLAELKCPIVLTTRFEHLSSMFGNFEALLEDLGSKRGATPARLLTLKPWTREAVRKFIESARQEATAEEQVALNLFSSALDDGSLARLYGDLPFHPLFLQFILDDVCSDGLKTRRRTDLVGSWVRRKISRDIQHHGSPVDRVIDRYEIVEGMICLMENVAAAMIAVSNDIQLTERIDSRHVERLSVAIFNVEVPIATLLLYGFLVPVAFRKGSHLEVRFVLRILQEYFLARHIRRARLSTDRYPASIQEFAGDLSDEFL